MDYIFGPEVMKDGYNVAVIREHLTRSLGTLYGDIHDEIRNAFDHLIPATEDGVWYACRTPRSCAELPSHSVARGTCVEDSERCSC